MKRISTSAIFASLFFAATPLLAADPITDAISGKTVKAERGDTVKFHRNGRLTGKVGPK